MKKTFYLLIVFTFLLVNQHIAQINWVQLSSGTFENLRDVYFYDVNTGWVVGNAGQVLKTTNYGQTWNVNSFPALTNNNCVFFVNANTGFIGNSNGNVYKTTNGGTNWASYPSGISYEVTSLFFTSETIGYLGSSNGQIRYTSNAGVNWTYIGQVPGRVNKINFVDAFRGWAVENYGFIYRTTNAGANFYYTRPSSNAISGIQFISTTYGYACGDSGRIYKSTNGGVNWTEINTGYTSVKLNKIALLHPEIVIAVGSSGNILHTIDGGTNWIGQLPTAYTLNGIFYIPNSIYGYCVGDLGIILRSFTTPGGGGCIGNSTTQVGYPFISGYMDGRTDMLFLRNEIALVTGMNAGYIRSIGFYFTNYSNQALNNFKIKMQNTTMNSVTQFTSSGWMIAYDSTYTVPGTGLRTINLQVPFYWSGNNILMEICFNNSANSTNSTVYSTSSPNRTYYNRANLPTGDGCVDITTGSVQTYRPNVCFYLTVISGTGNSHNYTPDKFSLHQNYPNPFNPVTKIQYDIAKKSDVTLNIYDILGKHIETMVNETKDAGSYIVEYNASALPSGLYFYKLEAGNFSEVKKMILIK